MKANFVKYYLPVFGVALAAIFPVILLNYNSNELLDMIIGLSTVLIFITLLVGTLNYKFGDKLREKVQKKSLKKGLFQQFIYNGFDKNEVSVFGYIDDYSVTISDEQDSQPRKWIKIVILFNPKQENQFIPRFVFNKLYEKGKRNYSWNSNCLIIEKVYGFKMPKYISVRGIIKEAISLLKNNNISPIKVEDWNLSIEESVKHYNQTISLKK
ncbi:MULTISPECIES: hypothetical protein [Tenacibaculum]|uniref:hypothetical protein n=1 Tax=Tenacibaculum TaxID=104267 RepID=UPI001F0ADDC3|nr:MULTISPECIES: hypothetical protein [Tenacibaculum]MCH3883105.1 hypothetical protein [Tenacibaculum aquimarinum]MDO6600600.1 hypothetical protein [Tenacibaculum sp. 1_MG-2023]